MFQNDGVSASKRADRYITSDNPTLLKIFTLNLLPLQYSKYLATQHCDTIPGSAKHVAYSKQFLNSTRSYSVQYVIYFLIIWHVVLCTNLSSSYLEALCDLLHFSLENVVGSVGGLSGLGLDLEGTAHIYRELSYDKLKLIL